MGSALRCDHCKQFTESGHSLLYKFVGFFADERENFKASMLEHYDLCDECFDIVEIKLREILK